MGTFVRREKNLGMTAQLAQKIEREVILPFGIS